ncbi:protein kinase [bacterium]|jgi:serine/threonine protein kinase|nr:protein kinase [bacterium]
MKIKDMKKESNCKNKIVSIPISPSNLFETGISELQTSINHSEKPNFDLVQKSRLELNIQNQMTMLEKTVRSISLSQIGFRDEISTLSFDDNPTKFKHLYDNSESTVPKKRNASSLKSRLEQILEHPEENPNSLEKPDFGTETETESIFSSNSSNQVYSEKTRESLNIIEATSENDYEKKRIKFSDGRTIILLNDSCFQLNVKVQKKNSQNELDKTNEMKIKDELSRLGIKNLTLGTGSKSVVEVGFCLESETLIAVKTKAIDRSLSDTDLLKSINTKCELEFKTCHLPNIVRTQNIGILDDSVVETMPLHSFSALINFRETFSYILDPTKITPTFLSTEIDAITNKCDLSSDDKMAIVVNYFSEVTKEIVKANLLENPKNIEIFDANTTRVKIQNIAVHARNAFDDLIERKRKSEPEKNEVTTDEINLIIHQMRNKLNSNYSNHSERAHYKALQNTHNANPLIGELNNFITHLSIVIRDNCTNVQLKKIIEDQEVAKKPKEKNKKLERIFIIDIFPTLKLQENMKKEQIIVLIQDAVAEYVTSKILLEDIISVHIRNKLVDSILKNLSKQILESLAGLEESSLIHGDVKATNILVGDDMALSLGDLELMEEYDPENPNNSSNTIVKQAKNSPDHFAPELLKMTNEEMYKSCAVDVWAFGCLLHNLKTGTYIFGQPLFNRPAIILAKIKSYGAKYDTLDELFPTQEITKPVNPDNSSTMLPTFEDFTHRLCNPDPEKRMTAKEALNHPWMVKVDKTINNDLVLNLFRRTHLHMIDDFRNKHITFDDIVNSDDLIDQFVEFDNKEVKRPKTTEIYERDKPQLPIESRAPKTFSFSLREQLKRKNGVFKELLKNMNPSEYKKIVRESTKRSTASLMNQLVRLQIIAEIKNKTGSFEQTLNQMPSDKYQSLVNYSILSTADQIYSELNELSLKYNKQPDTVSSLT